MRVPDDPPDAYIVNVFGWTLGGVVALQYDSSLVGPYLEFVEMGALVVRNGCIGQWGSRLLVSNEEAKEACEDVWSVPAGTRALDYVDEGDTLVVEGDDASSRSMAGPASRAACDSLGGGRRRCPALWTPQDPLKRSGRP